MSDDEYAPAPDFVVLDYIDCSVHSAPAFKRRARDAWQQVAEERDAAVDGYAAMAAGLDAVVAEFIRWNQDLAEREAWLHVYRDQYRARAESAEAQLAAAREDLAATLGRARQAEIDLAAGRDGLQLVIAVAREAGARDFVEWMCDEMQYPPESEPTDTRRWYRHRLAAWRAAQGTEAKP